MARGLMNALQAALAGVSGGSAGYAKYQQQMKDEQARQQEMERQRLRDALAQSQFGLQQKEFEARYGPEALKRAEEIRNAELKFKAEQDKLDREAELERARISAGATAGAERMRQAQELQQSRLAGRAFLGQARRAGGGIGTELLGNVIANEVVRRGRQLTQDEIDDLSAAVMGNIAGERRMIAAELAASGELGGGFGPPAPPSAGGGANSSLAARQGAGQPMAGGSYGSTVGAPKTEEDRAREWMDANPIRSGESQSEYAARMRAAVGA